PPDSHNSIDRRVGDRGVADRAIRDGRARPGQPCLRDGGWSNPIFRPGQRAAREIRPAPVGLSVEGPPAPQRWGRLTGAGAGGGPAAPGMSVGALEHVLVLADDIDGTRDFYCEVVGLSVGERPPLAFPGYWLYATSDGSGPACLHVAERGAYAAHAAGLGLDVP